MRTGPNLVNDNLVFQYDLNDEKSYAGPPTTNVVNPSWSAWGTDGSGQGAVGTRTILSPYHCRIIDSTSNTRQSIWVEGLSPNTTYVFSVKYKKLFGAPTLRYQIQPYNGGTYITSYFPTTRQIEILDIDGWQTARYVITTPANTTRALWFMQDGDDYTTYTHTFELKDVQVELGAYPTKFTATSRGGTESLFDRTGTQSSINVSTASVTSRGKIAFDGTNDYIQLNNSIGNFGVSPFTISGWWKSNGTQSAYTSIISQAFLNPITQGGWSFKVKNHTNENYLSFSYATGYQLITNLVTTTNPNDGKWHNVAITRNGDTITFYMDGVSIGTNSIGATTIIGQDVTTYVGYTPRDSSYLNGILNSLQIYNTSLTSSEIWQNYISQNEKYNSSILQIEGEWVKVFRHYSGRGQTFSSSNDWAEAKRSNPLDPQSDKYSILDTVKNYRIDDKYTFKLVYPTLGVTNIWSQTNNPVTDPGTGGVSSYSAISVDRTENGWGGLERYDGTTATFLDGTLSPIGNWYYAIGVQDLSWGGGTTFPGPSEAVDEVELWIKY